MSAQTPALVTVEPITSGVRSNIVDIVKGIAIILVVYGHTAQGMGHRGWWTGPAADFSDVFIYSFHMPAFFFVAGLFVTGSIAKRGAKRFTTEKLKTILYPYLLMCVITAALEPLIGRFKVNTVPFRWNTFLRTTAEGEASWFLFVLFFCLMLALLTVLMPSWLRFLAAICVALLPLFGPRSVGQVLHEFCFVAAGMWVGTRIYRMERLSATATAFGLALLTVFQVAIVYTYGRPLLFQWTYIPLGITGTAGLLLLAKLLDRHRIGNDVAWVGRASLAIFLFSPFAQGVGREILLRVFHTHEFWLQLLVPTFLATVLPAILWYQQDRWRLGWLFHWPF